jgi:hypothetical protein
MVIIRVAPKLAAYQPERQQIVFPPQKPGWCVAPRRYRTIDGALLGIGDCSRCAEYPVNLFSTQTNPRILRRDSLGTRIYIGGVTPPVQGPQLRCLRNSQEPSGVTFGWRVQCGGPDHLPTLPAVAGSACVNRPFLGDSRVHVMTIGASMDRHRNRNRNSNRSC